MDDDDPHFTNHGTTTVKRTRVLLSCGPCRASKLKCDRSSPCQQCIKKGKTDDCLYAPKPEKKRPARSMATRLKRLEAMVRDMMEEGAKPQTSAPARDESVSVAGQVVHGERGATYVGATHFMAILEDIEDLKSYFDEPSAPENGNPEQAEDLDATELLLLSQGSLRNRDDLLALLPERTVADRLIMRYFHSNSPSVHIVHRPTFQKQYAEFWQDPYKVPIHWLALLFMVMGLGVFFSSFVAPHELQGDSPETPMDRLKLYRSAAGRALIWGRYAQPTAMTLQPLLLYVEAEFLINRASQTNCYLLSSVCVRLMMKMGLHRDPSKLANIGPFEGEMRRRMWNLGIQIDLLVSFHMGLPSMMYGIETDTVLPRNLLDSDFDEKSTELPLARPNSDYTTMSYPINKAALCRVFGQVARHAHSLTPPAYAEVLKIDALVEETWKAVPDFMKPRPLDESITDPPMQIIQRFGLASLYNKSRCVLHRRYLAEAVPRKEHDYSRRTCLEAALSLLDFQDTIWQACQPGHLLSTHGWFVSSLAVHDFLLAAMIVYLVIRTERYSEAGGDYDGTTQPIPTPTKDKLRRVLWRCHDIWTSMAQDTTGVKKAAQILSTMLGKVESLAESESSGGDPTPLRNGSSVATGPRSAAGPFAALSISDRLLALPAQVAGETPYEDDFQPMDLGGQEPGTAGGEFNPEWVTLGDDLDWRYFDNAITQRDPDINIELAALDRTPVTQLDFLASGLWDPLPNSGS